MWKAGMPGGFCDRPAYGEQYTDDYYIGPRNKPFATAMCCDWHGGPSKESPVRFCRDGNMWCAFRPGFENLHESIVGFGKTQSLAHSDLISNETQSPPQEPHNEQ
jgi:hypothetical protein